MLPSTIQSQKCYLLPTNCRSANLFLLSYFQVYYELVSNNAYQTIKRCHSHKENIAVCFKKFEEIFGMIDRQKFSCVSDFYNTLKQVLVELQENLTELAVVKKIQDMLAHIEKVFLVAVSNIHKIQEFGSRLIFRLLKKCTLLPTCYSKF